MYFVKSVDILYVQDISKDKAVQSISQFISWASICSKMDNI